MTQFADETDRFIAGTLTSRGRVSPSDLTSVAEEDREGALRAFFERYAPRTPIHFEGSALVFGPPPAPPATPAAAELSDVERLLEGYDGVSGARPDPEQVFSMRESASISPSSATGAGMAAAPAQGKSGPPPAIAASPLVRAIKLPPKGSRAWLAWWAAALFVPLVGGLAAWYVLRHRHEHTIAARVMLGIGVVTGVLASLLFLRYASDIAGVLTGAARDTVIEVPAK